MALPKHPDDYDATDARCDYCGTMIDGPAWGPIIGGTYCSAVCDDASAAADNEAITNYQALRAAARAVVEAWSSSYGWTVASEDKLSNAIIALRSVLEGEA